MPGIDGWELQRLAVTQLPSLPIIFITAHHDDVSRQRAIDLGAFAILYKPFDGEEFLETVGAATKQFPKDSNRL
jgi:DNA-binding response OmpR family regulator